MRQLGALWALLAALWAGAAPAEAPPRIVAVTYALQAMTQRLVGDAAEVVFPVPAGVDPSFWRPGIADISAIQSADLIVLNGAGFATWVDRVSLPRSRVVDAGAALRGAFIVTESITHSHGDGGTHSHEALASYLWLDPMQAAAQADAVAAALVARGLAPQAEVAAARAALVAELTALDAGARATLGPAAAVPMIATHPRYQYFARSYGLSISALDWEAGAMPDADQLAALEALAARTGARVLIWEAAPPQAAMEAAAALGLASAVFPPLAQPPEAGGLIDALRAAIAAVADAARRARP